MTAGSEATAGVAVGVDGRLEWWRAEVAGRVVRCQERQDLLAQRGITSTCVIEERVSLGRLLPQCRMEDLRDLPPLFGRHLSGATGSSDGSAGVSNRRDRYANC